MKDFEEIVKKPFENLQVIQALLKRARKSKNSDSLPPPECFSSEPKDKITLIDYAKKRDAFAQQMIEECLAYAAAFQ